MNQETPKKLADLFDTFFRSDEHAKKVNIVLDISTIYVIFLLMKHSPELLNEIELEVVTITNKDIKLNYINYKNMLHKMTQKLCTFILNLREVVFENKECTSICSRLFKYIIHILVFEGRIKVEEEIKPTFLRVSDKMVDETVQFLVYPIPDNSKRLAKPKGCFDCVY